MKRFAEVLIVLIVIGIAFLMFAQLRPDPWFFNDRPPNRMILHCPKCKVNRSFTFRTGDQFATCPTCGHVENITRILQRLENPPTEDSNPNSEAE